MKKNDINQFYKDLMDKEEKSATLVNEWPEAKPQQTKVEQFKPPVSNDLMVEDLYDSNLSNLYEKIMKGHNTDFIKNSPVTAQPKVAKAEEQKAVSILKQIGLQSEPEASFLTEFNPPTQRLGKDRSKLDYSFQSGMSDLRRALEDEEQLDNVSDCSFVEGKPKPNPVESSNILDKGALMASQMQNSLH